MLLEPPLPGGRRGEGDLLKAVGHPPQASGRGAASERLGDDEAKRAVEGLLRAQDPVLGVPRA
jgi:hypothetical protein